MSSSLEQRFDLVRITRKWTLTPQGFLRCPAGFTRSGILEYRRHDGTVRKEFRPSEEVFDAKSIETLLHAPVTDLHPTKDGKRVMVDAHNAREFMIGSVVDVKKFDDRVLGGELVVHDAGEMELIRTVLR